MGREVATLKLAKGLGLGEQVAVAPEVGHALEVGPSEEGARGGLAVPLALEPSRVPAAGRARGAGIRLHVAHLEVVGLGVGAETVVGVDRAGDGGHVDFRLRQVDSVDRGVEMVDEGDVHGVGGREHDREGPKPGPALGGKGVGPADALEQQAPPQKKKKKKRTWGQRGHWCQSSIRTRLRMGGRACTC